ncbi:hypothetical protein GPECTOR_104g88 [Gonium pectorale]|uniref:ABC transporter domain-containing protein n=1 Tax=Gonium pectorale TaxID=33097 RepID=A0A150FZQ9_GONPE|nr:hypothetical protein GPECTOR_104g88 [Gonium pectorale]|eukprot:KXZ43082.1 hypothetical protein GPECTOR_104g88 [Gonium pectorale]
MRNAMGHLLFGQCAERCSCRREEHCSYGWECGAGLFCMAPSSPPSGGVDGGATGQPTCQAEAVRIYWTATGSSSSPNIANATNATSSATTTSPPAASDPAGYVSGALSNIYHSTQTGDGEPLSLLALASVMSGPSRAVLCPRTEATDPATGLPAFPRLAAPGCPCTAVPDAAFSRCPAGHICSRQAFRGLPTDDPAALTLRAVCIPCLSGQYCPEGSTTVKDSSGGWIQRLRDGRGPIRGNYCPENSTTPEVKCPGGHYCPDPATLVRCDSGSYCKPQSVFPVPCPPLASCPEGTVYPSGDRTAGLLFGLILAGTCVSLLVAKLGVWVLEVVTRYNAALETILAAKEQEKKQQERLEQQQQRQEGKAPDRSGNSRSAAGAPSSSTLAQLLKTYGKEVGVTDMRIDIFFNNVTGRLQRSSADKDKGPGATKKQPGSKLMGISGQLFAESGPSGCGKSTLVKILSGRILPAEGVTVYFNDQRGVVLSATDYRRLLGFVPQEDVLHANLTVRENLEYSARLTMKPETPSLVRHAMVYAFLKVGATELNLLHRQDRIVGSEQSPRTSGGERKRINIGMGMVALPPVLILDEPTSGLDASISHRVVELMTDLAQHASINVITVLHQPREDSFLLFDNVLVLAHNGMVVYEGSPAGCLPYFQDTLQFKISGNTNMADFILDITTGSVSEKCRSKLDVRWDDLPFMWLLQFAHTYQDRFQKMRQELTLSDKADDANKADKADKADKAEDPAPPATDNESSELKGEEWKLFEDVYSFYLERTAIKAGSIRLVDAGERMEFLKVALNHHETYSV